MAEECTHECGSCGVSGCGDRTESQGPSTLDTNARSSIKHVIGVVSGSCLYRFIVAVALRFNVPAAAMKLVSALIVAVAISMPAIRAKFAFEQRKHNARKEVH